VNRLIAWVLLICTTWLAACNTVAGAGQDISKGGHAITNSAEKAQSQ
jgi:entericidin B